MKTKLLSLIISLFACSLLVAQEQPIQKVDVNGVYLIPDKMPEYPGGVPAMMKFLSSNVKYPVEAQKNAISGRVIVQFVVMEDGTLSQAKVIRGVDPLLDEEALRVVKEMPKWTPGIVDGKTVKVKFTVPIMFSLQKNSSKNVPFKLVIPNGQEIKNKRMQGVWQTCMVESVEKGYRLSLGPLLKFISVYGCGKSRTGEPSLRTRAGALRRTGAEGRARYFRGRYEGRAFKRWTIYDSAG